MQTWRTVARKRWTPTRAARVSSPTTARSTASRHISALRPTARRSRIDREALTRTSCTCSASGRARAQGALGGAVISFHLRSTSRSSRPPRGRDASARAHCEQVVVRDVEEPDWIEELNRRRFDVIVFADVLEHLRDPARVLRETLELLAPDTGFIVASIPNVAHVSVRLELLLGSFRRETLGILDATHLHFFTRDSLEEFLASCGIAAESWDCTTNEIADHVVADYLQRAGLPYTLCASAPPSVGERSTRRPQLPRRTDRDGSTQPALDRTRTRLARTQP